MSNRTIANVAGTIGLLCVVAAIVGGAAAVWLLNPKHPGASLGVYVGIVGASTGLVLMFWAAEIDDRS